jgi:hypothetical protein
MNDGNAAGRKTEQPASRLAPSGPLENYVEAQLAVLTEGLRAAFARAAAVEPQRDEYGHVCGNHISDAVSIAKSSAKLLLAAAKVRGRFQHNISVSRRAPEEDDGLTDEDRFRIDVRRSKRLAAVWQQETAEGGPPSQI